MRLYVMGPMPGSAPPLTTSAPQLAALLDESMAAGAFGFSTSFFDADAQSRPVPSRLADDAEREALVEVLGRHRRGLVEFIPNTQAQGGDRDVISMVEMCGRHGVASTINSLVAMESRPEYAGRAHGAHAQAARGGSAFWPQMSPRTIDFRINWETSMVFMMLPEWHRIPNAADDAERARLLRDPNWRAAATSAVGRDSERDVPVAASANASASSR